MRFSFFKVKELPNAFLATYSSGNEVAALVFGKRAVFYYPPGCGKGWTLKRIVVVSLFCYLGWSLFFAAASWFAGFLWKVWL